jgi:ABC-type transport system involved in cytochrome c biogenesis permease subunit
MADTRIRTTPGKPSSGVTATPANGANGADGITAAPAPRTKTIEEGFSLRSILLAVSSLRLTVLLFVLAIGLVFLGTLAQVDEGIWTVLQKYFRSGLAWIPVQALVRFGQVFFSFPQSWDVPRAYAFPYPGGWLLGSLLLLNLLAAHAVRFKLNWKRSGVMILHAGLVIMMVSELLTGVFATEGRMTIVANGTASYTEDTHAPEYVFINAADPKEEHVFAIPARLLREGKVLRDARLPVDVRVEKYMKNSSPPQPPAAGTHSNPATAGDGLKEVAEERKENGGVDASEDLPSAYVTFLKKGTDEPLGTYLVSTWWSSYWLAGIPEQPQVLRADGKTYNVFLRFKRTYKPYTVHLLQFTHGVYPGTDIAKNFASRVEVEDPTSKREVEISMNAPLRYGGETFYQSQFLPGDKGTVLQVVHNPGWLMPYVSCVLVAFGMLLHFGIMLANFRRPPGTLVIPLGWKWMLFSILRPEILRPEDSVAPDQPPMHPFFNFLPAIVVGVVALCLVLAAVPPSDPEDGFQFVRFGHLPVQADGRVKPLDTFARTKLQVISHGNQEYKDEKGDSQPAVKWYLDVLTSGELFKLANEEHSQFPITGEKLKVFRIDNDKLLTQLHLERREGLRYSIAEFGNYLGRLGEVATEAEQKDPKVRDAFETKAIELAQHVKLYIELTDLGALHVLPKESPEEKWDSLQDGLRAAHAGKTTDRGASGAFVQMLVAYAHNKPKEFNSALKDYEKAIGPRVAGMSAKVDREVWFNHFAPFFVCAILYALVIVLACLSFVGWSEPLRRSAFWLAVLTLVVHTFALGMRMYLQGRPPVTNLYSSAVFIGWGCLVLGLLLEAMYRNGLGLVVAAACGFSTMLIAQHLGSEGDTLEMLQAVLDTNFWLATHVTCVTLGYTATFFAGFLGICYVLLGVFTPRLDAKMQRSLGQMIYGVVCFATLLSFVGTVLGGIWADQSWGRFWGWDPKENGALLIVIMNALILHARWAGIVKGRGMAVLTIVGNMVTGWSWFGTNQLGVGLHAYGFNNTLALGLVIFWGTQLGLIALGLMPREWWRSFARRPAGQPDAA